MDELTTILKHEKDNKEKLDSIRKSAEQEIEIKKKESKEKLLREASLTEEEKEKIKMEKKTEIEAKEKILKEDFDSKMKKLEEKKSQNMQEAVDYIIKNSLER